MPQYILPTESIISISIGFVDFGIPCLSSILVYLWILLKDILKTFSGIISLHISIPITHTNFTTFALVELVLTANPL